MNNPYAQKPIFNPNSAYVKPPVQNVGAPKPTATEVSKDSTAPTVEDTKQEVTGVVNVNAPVMPKEEVAANVQVTEIPNITVVGIAYDEKLNDITKAEVLFNKPDGTHGTMNICEFAKQYGTPKQYLSEKDWAAWEDICKAWSESQTKIQYRDAGDNTTTIYANPHTGTWEMTVVNPSDNKKDTTEAIPDTPKEANGAAEEKQAVVNVSPQNNLDAVMAELAKNAEENEDISAIREQQHKEFGSRDPSELVKEGEEVVGDGLVKTENTYATDASGKPDYRIPDQDPLPPADISIFEADKLEEKQDADFTEAAKNVVEAKGGEELSDADAATMIDLMLAYKKNRDLKNVYGRMPECMKKQVMNICFQGGYGLDARILNMIAKAMLDEMIAETGQDQTFIDLEKSLEEAAKIPSLVDIYQENVGASIEEKLPAMADAIEKEDPEKAKMLRDVALAYKESINFERLYHTYDTDSRTRKLVRRDYDQVSRFLDEINFRNADTKFRMGDARGILPILIKLVVNDPTNDITKDEANKFCVLVSRDICQRDPEDLVSAAYIYYLVKNLRMLSTVDPAKDYPADSFSVELISNIRSLIYYIRAKEAQANANSDRSPAKKPKRSQRGRQNKHRK